jgi:hypothetical protein
MEKASVSRDAAAKDGSKPRALSVEIGTPDPATGIDFVPLMPGGDIALETFGQGGTHATVAIRSIGFGGRAFVDVTVENPDEGTQVVTVPSVRPQLWACDPKDLQVCDDSPIHVMTGGLTADPNKKDGLMVTVVAVVHTQDGKMAMGTQDGILRKNF